MTSQKKNRLLLLGRQATGELARGANSVSEVEVVSSVEEAMAAIDHSAPDVILIDFEMPGPPGMQRLDRIKKYSKRTPVIALVEDDDLTLVSTAIAEGAAGFLRHGTTTGELDDAIRVVRGGGTYLDPKSAAKMMSKVDESGRAADTPAAAQLSGREQEVLTLLAEGLSARQIATRLTLSERTVNAHVANVYRKLGVGNRVEAIRAAIRMGLVAVPE